MPRYSPVGPISILWDLQKHDMLGEYLLVLAHEVNNYKIEYRELVARMRDPFIIVDNGVIEQGEPVSIGELLEAAETVHAEAVVSPDVLRNFPDTMMLAREQVPLIREAGFTPMLIPQGRDMRDLRDCVMWMDDEFKQPYYKNKSYWGIPRWIANDLGTRMELIEYLEIMGTAESGIHLLGMSRNQGDDIMCCKNPNVMGIDSANPLVLGYNGLMIESGHHINRGDYWLATEVNWLMRANVEWMRNAIGDISCF